MNKYNNIQKMIKTKFKIYKNFQTFNSLKKIIIAK